MSLGDPNAFTFPGYSLLIDTVSNREHSVKWLEDKSWIGKDMKGSGWYHSWDMNQEPHGNVTAQANFLGNLLSTDKVM